MTIKKNFLPIEIFKGEGIKILDQSLLPGKKTHVFLKDTQSVINAIQSLQLRGAPLIGIAGVCGLAIGSSEYGTEKKALEKVAKQIMGSRPTANELGLLVTEALQKCLELTPRKRNQFLWNFAEKKLELQKQNDLKIAKLGATLSGITGGVLLALGRAMGETMAVTMIIGNSNNFSLSLLAPGNTIAAMLANQFGEADGSQVSSLMYAAFILMILKLAVNILALSPRNLVLLSGYEKTNELLIKENCILNLFDGNELCIKAEGGPTCLTRPILRH